MNKLGQKSLNMALLSSVWKGLLISPRRISVDFQPVRNCTWVVERRNPARLTKPHKRPSLRAKHFVYDAIQDNTTKPQHIIPILLKKFVENVGQPGEIVNLKEQQARLLIMTHKADYPSPENIKMFGSDLTEKKTYSSKYAATTLQLLQKFVLNISMSKENPWTLEKWHIRSAFRKAGVHVPESTFTMPDHVISGPDLALEGKEFYVTVKLNGKEEETVTVRCRIHHWATSLRDKVPRVRDHWKFPVEPIFADDKEITKTLPEMIPPVFDELDDFKPPTFRKR